MIHNCPENWIFHSIIADMKTCTSVYPFIYCVSYISFDSYFPQFKLISHEFPLALDSSAIFNYCTSIISLSFPHIPAPFLRIYIFFILSLDTLSKRQNKNNQTKYTNTFLNSLIQVWPPPMHCEYLLYFHYTNVLCIVIIHRLHLFPHLDNSSSSLLCYCIPGT